MFNGLLFGRNEFIELLNEDGPKPNEISVVEHFIKDANN